MEEQTSRRERRAGMTYVPGLGFVPEGSLPQRTASTDDIRRMANLLCLFLLFYPFFQKVFALPLVYLAYLTGFDVRINRLTGMISQSEMTRILTSFLTDAISLLIIVLLVAGIYHRCISDAHILRRPHRGVLPLAVPLTLACGVLGSVFSLLLCEILQDFGLVLYTHPEPIGPLSLELFTSMAVYLLFAVFQEFFFRGILLTPLRRFGDGFAILVSAMLYAVWCDGILEAISGFVFGVCAAYFVVRSGSVRTAMISRAVLVGMAYAFRLLNGMVERSLATVVIIVACLAAVALAVLAYVRFVKLDSNAFRLVQQPPGTLSARSRLGAFCGSICFILLLVSLLFRAVDTVQIIG